MPQRVCGPAAQFLNYCRVIVLMKEDQFLYHYNTLPAQVKIDLGLNPFINSKPEITLIGSLENDPKMEIYFTLSKPSDAN
jgi:hypothetical protein